jgi:LmbE family N-acetylglucosaminyl deacetylase
MPFGILIDLAALKAVIEVSNITLMAVFAHPDDEAFGVGGTLARYAAEGCDVHLVTATRGEAGEIRDPNLATKANLPQVREQELRCACEIYGIHPPRFLDYVDGQLAVMHQGQAVGRLVRIIREVRPQVLITFGPEGIYGHYDHIAVHRWTTIAYDLAADQECFPDPVSGTCAPHQASKLYYQVLSKKVLSYLAPQGKPATVMMDNVPFPMVGYRRDEITTVIDVGDHVETKLRGLMCHSTQIDASSASEEAQQMINSPLFCQETYILARSQVGWPDEVEKDLCRGLRE